MDTFDRYAQLDVLREKLRKYEVYMLAYAAKFKLPVKSITIDADEYYKLLSILNKFTIQQHLLFGYPLDTYSKGDITMLLPCGAVRILRAPIPETVD